VVDAAGRPVAQARVYVVRAPVAVADVAALTGPDGRFTLSAAHPGSYQIACSTDRLGSASTTVEVGAVENIVVLRFDKA
jgi:hypothetical protein